MKYKCRSVFFSANSNTNGFKGLALGGLQVYRAGHIPCVTVTVVTGVFPKVTVTRLRNMDREDTDNKWHPLQRGSQHPLAPCLLPPGGGGRRSLRTQE